MANIILNKTMSLDESFAQMQEDAKYDVADAELFQYNTIAVDEVVIPDMSLFSDIKSNEPHHKIPKIYVSGTCTFNCAYCGCRASHVKNGSYCLNPREVAQMAVKSAKDNGHGIFVSSAIYKNADYTEELIVESLRIMRKELHYNGFIHAKVMPGADPLLIEQAGRYANRLSVNIEVAHSDGYKKIAKQKTKQNILTPMQQISDLIKLNKQSKSLFAPKFAGTQTTQMMAGSTGETDRTIMILSKAMYKKYDLKRVYYTPFTYKYDAEGYDKMPYVFTPLWRIRRLYQADRLIKLYGFTPDEITPDDAENLPAEIDPKISWALRNIHMFPIEVNKADYEQLLRIPGIGIVYAKKIMRARKYYKITHEILKQIGVSLKRARYFITCDGVYSSGDMIDNPSKIYEVFAVESGKSAQYSLLDKPKDIC